MQWLWDDADHVCLDMSCEGDTGRRSWQFWSRKEEGSQPLRGAMPTGDGWEAAPIGALRQGCALAAHPRVEPRPANPVGPVPTPSPHIPWYGDPGWRQFEGLTS